MEINKILFLKEGEVVQVNGWVRYNRALKDLGFFELFDGSNLNGIQVVYKKSNIDEKSFNVLTKMNIFSALDLKGKLVKNQKNNTLELELLELNNYAPSDEDNPLQKKIHSLEFLREISSLRPRTKTFQAVFKMRSKIIFYLHQFFFENDFIYVNSPIITSNDAEGAGESFKVVTSEGKNFFSNSASLSVSGQLHAEAFAQSFKKVYTLGPTFRAENSNTVKHASEFWMLEPEVAFSDYNEAMDLSANMLSFVAQKIKETMSEEISFLETFNKVNLLERFELLINKKICKIEYKQALDILSKHREMFEEKNIEFGLDLATEHEKFIASYFPGQIVYIFNYPKEIKAFYMKQNQDGKTVRGFDLIIPEIGELIGGSERENDFSILLKRVEEMNIDSEELSWYLELRRFGYMQSTGFGLGIERLIMFLTGMKNIRDVLPFPRTPGKINY